MEPTESDQQKSPRELITVYLQDHHAGASAGLALAQRIAGSSRAETVADEVRALEAEIAEDKQSLERVIAEFGASTSRVKDLGAQAAERLGRLKRNGTWMTPSPSSLVLELEGLIMGVTGKTGLWEALQVSIVTAPEGLDFAQLAERARDQRSRIEALHRKASRAAFAPTP